MTKREKLETLVDCYGFADIDEMMMTAVMDSVAPAICTNPDCDYCTDMEPDQTEGWCEQCETNTVVSCLVMAGIM